MNSKQILITIIIVIIAVFLWTNFVAKNPVSANQIKQEINYSDFNVTKTITFSGNERTEEYSFDLRNPVVNYLLLPKELVSSASTVKISGDFSSKIIDEDPLIKLTPTEYGPGKRKLIITFTDTNKQLTSILFVLPYVSFNELTTNQKTVLENGIKDLQTNSSIDNYTIDHSKIVMQQFANNQKKAGLEEKTNPAKISFAQPIGPQQILTSISQILKKKDQQTTIIPTNTKQKLSAQDFIQTTLASMNTTMMQKNPATSPNNYTMTIKFSAQKNDFPEDINFFVSEESLTDSETLFVENSSAPEVSVEGGLKEYFSVGAVQIDDQLYGIYIDLNIPQEVFDEMSMFYTLEQKVKVKLDLFNEKTVTVHLRKDFCLKRVNDAAKQIGLNEEQKHSIELSCYNEYFEGKKENLSSTLQAIEFSKAKVFFTQSEIDSIGSDSNDYPESTNSLEPVYRMEVLGLKVSGEAAQLEVLRKMRQNTVDTQNCEAYLPKDYLTSQTKPQVPASISDFSLINPEIRSYIPVQGRVLDEKTVMARVNATSKSQLNDYFNTEIKKIKDENNSYFLTNGIEQYLQEYSFWQCIYEKELANSQEYFAKAKDRLAGFKEDSDLDAIQSILENKLLISENEIDYINSKGELDLLSVQLQATASDKLLTDNWQVLCPYAQDKYECERKLFEQYTSIGPLSYSQLYYNPSGANLNTITTAGTQFVNYKQGHAYEELQIRLANLFFDANKYIEPTTKLIDQKNTSLLQEHEEYSNFFSCKTAFCSFYKELFAKRKTLKQTSISLAENDSWLTKLNYAKAMYSYLNYQSNYPLLTIDQKNEVILFAKKSKNQYIQQEILKAFSQETESETQLLTVFYSNLAAKVEELAKEKTGDGLTGKWEKFNFYTKTYINVYYWITFGATLRNEDFDELTFSGEVASFVGTRKILLKKFETYMNQNIKQKDYSIITDFYNKTNSEQGMYNQQAVLDATFKKYVLLETALKNFAENESATEVTPFLKKEQEESYNHAVEYSSNNMPAIARIKLASLMLNINSTDKEYRNTLVYDKARKKLIDLGVVKDNIIELGLDLGTISVEENSGAELFYTVLPPAKWISNLTYGTYKSMKNRFFEISDSDLQEILKQNMTELANNPLNDYRSFGEKVDSFLVAAGDLKWWPVYALVESVVPISAGISTVGKGFLRTTKVSTLNILGKGNYRVLVKWVNRSVESSSGLLKHQLNKLIYSQLGRAEYKVFKRQGPIYYFERLFAEKTVETFPGSAGVMRALTSTQPKSATKYLGKLAWGKASGKAFLDLPLEREVFRYSILAKFSPAITLSDDYARLAYEVAQDEGALLPISSGKFSGEAGILNTGKSKVLVLKRNTGWISQGNNTYLELDIKNAAFDTARGLYPVKPIAIDIGPTALDNRGLAQIIQAMETKNVTSETLTDLLDNQISVAILNGDIVLDEAATIAINPIAKPLVLLKDGLRIIPAVKRPKPIVSGITFDYSDPAFNYLLYTRQARVITPYDMVLKDLALVSEGRNPIFFDTIGNSQDVLVGEGSKLIAYSDESVLEVGPGDKVLVNGIETPVHSQPKLTIGDKIQINGEKYTVGSVDRTAEYYAYMQSLGVNPERSRILIIGRDSEPVFFNDTTQAFNATRGEYSTVFFKQSSFARAGSENPLNAGQFERELYHELDHQAMAPITKAQAGALDISFSQQYSSTIIPKEQLPWDTEVLSQEQFAQITPETQLTLQGNQLDGILVKFYETFPNYRQIHIKQVGNLRVLRKHAAVDELLRYWNDYRHGNIPSNSTWYPFFKSIEPLMTEGETGDVIKTLIKIAEARVTPQKGTLLSFTKNESAFSLPPGQGALTAEQAATCQIQGCTVTTPSKTITQTTKEGLLFEQPSVELAIADMARVESLGIHLLPSGSATTAKTLWTGYPSFADDFGYVLAINYPEVLEQMPDDIIALMMDPRNKLDVVPTRDFVGLTKTGEKVSKSGCASAGICFFDDYSIAIPVDRSYYFNPIQSTTVPGTVYKYQLKPQLLRSNIEHELAHRGFYNLEDEEMQAIVDSMTREYFTDLSGTTTFQTLKEQFLGQSPQIREAYSKFTDREIVSEFVSRVMGYEKLTPEQIALQPQNEQAVINFFKTKVAPFVTEEMKATVRKGMEEFRNGIFRPKFSTNPKGISFTCHSPCVWSPSTGLTITNPEGGSIAVLDSATGLDGLKVSGEFGKGFIKGTELVEYSSQDVAQKGITAIVKGKVSLPNISTGGIATIESAMKQGKTIALISSDGQSAQKITIYLTSSNIQDLKSMVTNIPNPESQFFSGTSTISQRRVAVQNALGIDYPAFENVKGWVLYDQGDDARRVRAIIEMDLRGVNEVVQYYTNPYGQIVVPPNPSAVDSFIRNYINGSITLQRLESRVFGPLETTGTNAATNYRESFNRFSESLNSSTVVPKQVQVEQINSPQEFQRIASSGLSAAPSAIQLAQSKGYQLEYKNGLKAFVAPRVRQFENTWAKGKTMENRVLLLGVYDEYSDALYVERYIAPRGTLQFRSEWVGQTKEDYDAYIKLHSEIVDLIDNYVYTRSQESLNQIAQYLDFLNKHGLLVTDEPTAYLARAYTSGDPNWYTYLDQVDVIGTSHIVNNTKAFQQYAASQIIQSEIVPSKKLYEVGTNHIHPSGATDPSFGDACAQAYLTQEGGIIKTIREKLGIIPKRPFTYSSISVDPTQTRGQGYVPLIVGENTCVNVLGVWRSGAIRPEDFHPNETIPILATTYTQ